MPEYIRKKLGERLVEEGLITQEQYEDALKEHWESRVILRQVLIDKGYISENALMEFMGRSLGIPLIKDLSGKITEDAVKLIPEKSCRQYTVIPLFTVKGTLNVAMADPFDVFAIDDLEKIAHCSIEPVLSKASEILSAIDKYYGKQKPLDEIVEGMHEEEDLQLIEEESEQAPDEEAVEVVDAPIIRLVNSMITQAVRERASDIHVEPDEKKLGIRYRVDGVLREAMMPPKRLQASIISRIKIMAGMDISVKRRPQDGRFKIRIENKDIDVRISTIPTTYGEKVVMRLLDKSNIRQGLGEAGFSPTILKQFEEMITRPYGIILVTGPTGSGKTTTLYMALQAVSSPEKNIITIEDPVEYELSGISQIAVNVKAGISFAQGLRSILRQDPDVIMVGEMRDLETADTAVRAALTGHLVFSTLHTNDAASSIVRLVDMGVPPYLVTSSLNCVMAQRLVRKLCPACRRPYQPDLAMRQELDISDDQEYTFYGPQGCDECAGIGYRGRTGIFEMLILDKETRKLIHSGESTDVIRQAAVNSGMKPLWRDGMEKVCAGTTSLEELKKVTFSDSG